MGLWERDKLTGDWGGARTSLSDKGFDFDLRFTNYWQWVASGGVNTNGEYGGTLDYRLNFDFGKLGLWKGGSVNMHARTRFGQDVSADAGSFVLPNAGMLMPSPGDYHGTDITGLVYSQFFPAFGTLANVTVGKLDVIDTVTGFFPHIGYGQEGFWNVNSMVSALPWFGAVRGLSLYGGVLSTVNTDLQMPESGFLVTGTTNVATNWGSVSDAFDEGAFLAGFHRFFWEKDGQPGYFMVFVGASTADQASNDPHDFIYIPGEGIENTKRKKPWDVALYVYQEFWKSEDNPDRKATFFTGGTLGPENPQFAQWNWFANVELFAPVKSRPLDRLGAAYWWNGLSDNFKTLVSPKVALRDLWGIEIYYNFALTPWLHLSADIQLTQSEREGDNPAFMPGLRLMMDF